MTADEFLKKVEIKSRVSVIEPFKDELLKLRKAGLSYNQLLEFLRENKVVVAYATFSLWMRRHMPADILPPPKNQPAKSPNQSKVTTSPSTPDTGPAAPAPSFFDKKRKPEVNLDFLTNED